MDNPPFHEVTDEEWEVLRTARPTLTWNDIASVYSPPVWCLDAGIALNWSFGCWSLTERKIKGPNSCKNCEMSIYFHQTKDQ